MAVAAIFVGIFTGITCFLVALFSGHGLIAAAGFYVMGGFLGASALALWALARGMAEGQLRRNPVVARS